MSADPIEAMLNSPKTIKAMQNLKVDKEDVLQMSREQLKAKLGNLKITKRELENKYEEYE